MGLVHAPRGALIKGRLVDTAQLSPQIGTCALRVIENTEWHQAGQTQGRACRWAGTGICAYIVRNIMKVPRRSCEKMGETRGNEDQREKQK